MRSDLAEAKYLAIANDYVRVVPSSNSNAGNEICKHLDATGSALNSSRVTLTSSTWVPARLAIIKHRSACKFPIRSVVYSF